MRVLVSGGAGYIGSHTVLQLIAAGHDVLIVDNFANAKPTVVNRLEALSGQHLPVHAFDLRDADKTEHLFAHEQIDAVIHFAGFKAVGRERAEAAGVLREQPRLDVRAGPGDAAAPRRQAGLLQLGHGLRRARHGAVR